MAIALSSFTLIPYALVLLQLRVFYAREQPWTSSCHHRRHHRGEDQGIPAGTASDRDRGGRRYLGLANGIGFCRRRRAGSSAVAPEVSGRPADAFSTPR